MNLPNKLTVMRILLIIPLVLFLQNTANPNNIMLAFIVFAVASITDILDGVIARKQNLVTTFGELMDPLADKILVMAAMLSFVELGWTPAFVVIIILAREFLVTSVRLIAASNGTVIAADKLGKIKTVVQMLWIMATMLLRWVIHSDVFDNMPWENTVISTGSTVMVVLMFVALGLTVISGINYVFKNSKLIFSDR